MNIVEDLSLTVYINNSLHLAQKYARIFVRGHYLGAWENRGQKVEEEKGC